MRKECVQMSLEDIYNDVSKSIEDKKPALIELLETHIDFETMIPTNFYTHKLLQRFLSTVWQKSYLPFGKLYSFPCVTEAVMYPNRCTFTFHFEA